MIPVCIMILCFTEPFLYRSGEIKLEKVKKLVRQKQILYGHIKR